jgi:DNA-binding winged helix-turn-helix (wHTH) protein
LPHGHWDPEDAVINDVVILRWPAEATRAKELAGAGVLRLLLVDPDADPPVLDDRQADWIRLPADGRDVEARVLGLTRRRWGDSEAAGAVYLDNAGRLFYSGQWVALSPIEARLAAALAESFGAVVTPEELVERAWLPGADRPRGVTPNTLRVHLTRLRRRIEPLGLEVRGVRGKGLVMDARADSRAGPIVRNRRAAP